MYDLCIVFIHSAYLMCILIDMKFKYPLLFVLLPVIAISFFFLLEHYINKSTCSTNKESVTIFVKDGSFDPATTTIKQCTDVIFQNVGPNSHWPASDLHPTHLIYPEFDPQQPVASGQSWNFVFDRIGKWRCHDHLHPQVRCIIEVTEQ